MGVKFPGPETEAAHHACAMRRAETLPASMQWLREHGDEYAGQWVAVRRGVLLACAPSLAELEALLHMDWDMLSTIVVHVVDDVDLDRG